MAWSTVSTIAAGVLGPERSNATRVIGAIEASKGRGQLIGDQVTPSAAGLGVHDGDWDRRHALRAVESQSRLRVILDVDVEQRMPTLDREQGAGKRERIHVVSQFGHHANNAWCSSAQSGETSARMHPADEPNHQTGRRPTGTIRRPRHRTRYRVRS